MVAVTESAGRFVRGMMKIPQKVFGSRNDRLVKRYRRIADAALPYEPQLRSLCSDGEDYDEAFARRSQEVARPDPKDADAVAAFERQLQEIRLELSAPLKARADEFRDRVRDSDSVEELLPEGFAILREASRRAQAHRHFDCQLIGGTVLYEGKVAEMRTGEGKTIVCHLAAFMRACQGLKVHIVTVNDYLVRRDGDFARPIFELLGYTVGYIQSQVDPGGREGIRQREYGCDLTYGTASEFGFDYLRDNMKTRLQDQVQGRLDYVIIDEVDSILIDEARTPLIISGPASDDVSRYPRADHVARELVRRQTQWDRKVLSTVAKFDGDTQNIPKLEDAMKILGWRGTDKKKGKPKEPQPDEADAQDEKGGVAALGPDFLTDDQVEAIQIYENNVLQIPPADQYRRYFIVQPERKQASITHEGVTIAQELLDIGSLYSGGNMEWPHLIDQSLRAHKVYLRDRDYVVQDGKVIIVDPFTGRLMHGRQWSDGLHQAVEAKERVTVKEESQTLATITIQNFFKLYKHRAGMTGTALTEGEEFMKIYQLDVVEIPTNRPVNRVDHNDTMYRNEEEKYGAIVDEIHEVHRRGRSADPFMLADVFTNLRPILEKNGQDVSRIDEALKRFNNAELNDKSCISFMLETYDELLGDLVRGRPILVGTTSVENSEKLSKLLERRYGIEHEVLNAKNHAREAEIVAKAGQQAIPERGQDKRPLGNVTIATNMAGRGTDIKLGHMVVYPTCRVPEELPAGTEPSELYPTGITKCCIRCEEYDPATNCAHCFKPKLDPRFPELGRKVCTINVPCGLHIIGTERHEARRIDNQLRGRSGRQGDPGSSRFSLSLEDDLLKMFMAPWMLKMMERIGFADGSSLEDKRLNKGIQRAQRKVEERNFSSRKHLLEWDKPMDFQRGEFYGARQKILEDRDVRGFILETLDRSIDAAMTDFLGGDYNNRCVVQWVRNELQITIDEDAIDITDFDYAVQNIREKAVDELHDQIRTSIGEYVDPEESPNNWDLGGLTKWASRLFDFNISQNQLRKMEPSDIEDALCEAAREHVEGLNLDGISVFLDKEYPYRALVDWAQSKFNLKLDGTKLVDESPGRISTVLKERVREAYRERELTYPVDFCIERAFGESDTAGVEATEYVCKWANAKYKVQWNHDDVAGRSREEVRKKLLDVNRDFMVQGRLEREVKENTSAKSDEEKLAWAKERFGLAWKEQLFAEANGNLTEAIVEQGREMLRWELSRLEQYVLLRIYDSAWKDHLLEMDHLKSAISQRPMAGDQTHAPSQFAIEGRQLFNEMWDRIAGRVTDVIFKVQAAGGPAAAPVQTTGTSGTDAAAVSYQHASAGSAFAGSRDEAAAMRAQNVEQKVETIRRDVPKVGRNDPCPCGSGKKYKQCCGKRG